eukprot:scaffold148_cov341-Pavlova_lutheri.AAC.55
MTFYLQPDPETSKKTPCAVKPWQNVRKAYLQGQYEQLVQYLQKLLKVTTSALLLIRKSVYSRSCTRKSSLGRVERGIRHKSSSTALPTLSLKLEEHENFVKDQTRHIDVNHRPVVLGGTIPRRLCRCPPRFSRVQTSCSFPSLEQLASLPRVVGASPVPWPL